MKYIYIYQILSNYTVYYVYVCDKYSLLMDLPDYVLPNN